MSDIHNVFIPHRHDDDARVAALKRLLESKGVAIRDASITRDKPNKAHDPDYIKNMASSSRVSSGPGRSSC